VARTGSYDVLVGASSADIRVKQKFIVTTATKFAP
jgi:hypothetical protein